MEFDLDFDIESIIIEPEDIGLQLKRTVNLWHDLDSG